MNVNMLPRPDGTDRRSYDLTILHNIVARLHWHYGEFMAELDRIKQFYLKLMLLA
jgi:hypothetical protein